MTLTLSKVMQRAWTELGHLTEVTATGGGTTTVIDTLGVAAKFTSDDALVGGTAIVMYDAGGAGAAPEGEFGRINDYVASTATFTIEALTAAIAAGDRIGLCRPTIAYQQMRQAVNDGLANLGTISLVDISLTTTSALQYTLPATLKIKKITDILIQDYDNGPYRSVIGLFEDYPAAPGSTGILEAREVLQSGRTLKILYEGVHPTLTVYSSVISETIQEELAVAAAVDKALTWLVSKRGDSALGTFILQRWNDAKVTLQQQKTDKPVYREKPRPRFFIGGDSGSYYPGDRNPR